MSLFRPIPILRIEGAAVFAATLAAYHHFAGDWRLFAVLFFIPDVSILPYFINNKAGWAAYNTAHSYVWPVLLAWIAQPLGHGPLMFGALVWCAHISWDRLCGFGMKEGENFWITHLGAIKTGRRLWLKLTGR